MIEYNSIDQVPIFPKAINLELTNQCNLNCKMCINGSKKFRKKGFMSNELINKVLEEVIENKKDVINGVDICGIGEPLLHNETINVVNKLKYYDIRTIMNTNGVLLNKENSKELLNSNIDKIMISLDSMNRETYKEVKGIDKFDSVIDNITNLLLLKKETNSKTIIQINMLNLGNNFDQIKDAVVYWNKFLNDDDVVYSREVKTLAGQVDDYRCTGNISLKEFKDNLSKQGVATNKFVVENWINILENINLNKKSPCRHLWNYTMILYNGDLSLCCIDFNGKLIVDNMKNKTIREIWNGKKYNDYRNIFINMNYDKLKLCFKCNEWYKCT
ncbi:radical SAM protein [Clostridium sp. JS66]|uniref:radical SAM/SPASM domain-containing protein n=1 Tax=Clostridium sp. JS66 TaxID=3064705 RepID=UPI00298E56B2|nr:radical SAM protein [Clostridium sp. JS66]WPC41037.1 radical SAM protein [Clostridium sp. JS66]